MTLLEKIRQDLKDAMKKGDKDRLSTLRMILSNVKNRQIEKKDSLDDQEIVRIIQGLVRQSKDAVEQFEKGNRSDLVAKEETFITICQAYLPEQLSEEDLEAIIRETVAEVGALSPKDMGKVMKAVMPKVAGRADGKLVNQKVRAILSENSP
ncbi:MAG: GatB/YqeY domain-containing protein [Deltaproteobacteria bacterium]|nr:GatB/YqeY domain-containing protein [Deltaproteobacteria bacterium]